MAIAHGMCGLGGAECQIGPIAVKKNGLIPIRKITWEPVNMFILDASCRGIISVQIFEAVAYINDMVEW
jgi:hypothetical protein